MWTVDRKAEGDQMGIIMTVVSKKTIKTFSFVTAVSKSEELTKTCHGERPHVPGQNAMER